MSGKERLAFAKKHADVIFDVAENNSVKVIRTETGKKKRFYIVANNSNAKKLVNDLVKND